VKCFYILNDEDMRNSLLFAAIVALAKAHGGPMGPGPDLAFENEGSVLRSFSSGSCCVNGVIASGNSTGQYKTFGAGKS
jgi:hypothetical protein